jgi:hypothetical protein
MSINMEIPLLIVYMYRFVCIRACVRTCMRAMNGSVTTYLCVFHMFVSYVALSLTFHLEECLNKQQTLNK